MIYLRNDIALRAMIYLRYIMKRNYITPPQQVYHSACLISYCNRNISFKTYLFYLTDKRRYYIILAPQVYHTIYRISYCVSNISHFDRNISLQETYGGFLREPPATHFFIQHPSTKTILSFPIWDYRKHLPVFPALQLCRLP